MAYYCKSIVTFKTKSIQASNDSFYFLKKKVNLFLDRGGMNDYSRVITNTYSHLYEDYSVCTDNLERVILLDNTTHKILRI